MKQLFEYGCVLNLHGRALGLDLHSGLTQNAEVAIRAN